MSDSPTPNALTPARTRLHSPREVMLAFLAGAKLQNKHYRDDTGEYHLYLDRRSGYLCEEDGAGAKVHRVDHFSYRDDDPEWDVIAGQPFGFTVEDVELLREIADFEESEDSITLPPALRSLASRIAALLPPQP